MKLDLITSKGFEKDIIRVDYFPKSPLNQAYIQITFKSGLLGERIKYTNEEIAELSIIGDEETSSDTGTRVKNAAIGTVLLGPVGLLGAAFGGKIKELKLKLKTNSDEVLLFQIKSKHCSDLFLNLAKVDLNELLYNDQLK